MKVNLCNECVSALYATFLCGEAWVLRLLWFPTDLCNNYAKDCLWTRPMQIFLSAYSLTHEALSISVTSNLIIEFLAHQGQKQISPFIFNKQCIA